MLPRFPNTRRQLWHRTPKHLLVLACVAGAATAARAESTVPALTPVPEILVTARMTSDTTIDVDPAGLTHTAVDAATLMRRVPGGQIANNGPVSSQVQYRGMFGPRMNVVVDGMHIAPGGPNWMDPPLHYVPGPLLASLEVDRGIAAVASGGETLGGTVRAATRGSEFTRGTAVTFSGGLESTVRSVDDGGALGGVLAAANNRHRFHVLGALERGGNVEFGGGTIGASRHERYSYGGGYGVRLGTDRELAVDYRHVKTDDTGNPALPMDIRLVDTDILKLSYRGRHAGADVDARLYYNHVDHAMDNVSLRAGAAAPRSVEAQSSGIGYHLSATGEALAGTLALGADGYLARHDMQILNPENAMFFVDNFDDARRRRYGLFAEWHGEASPGTRIELGLRYNHIRMRAAPASVGMMPSAPPLIALLGAFNAADRTRTDDNLDAVVKMHQAVTRKLTLTAGLGRKTRSPSYIERFAWLPVEATAGLADGNNYVGDLGLKPEVSYEAEAGLTYRDAGLSLAPRFFYRRVANYIQGAPVDATPETVDSALEMVSGVNGDPTPLRFTNVEAEFYGVDVAASFAPAPNLRLEGIISYVRGRRADIDDNLYRIPPLNSRLIATYRRGRLMLRAEGVFAADQNKISETNRDPRTADPRTDGHALLNLSLTYTIRPQARLTAGVDNVFDTTFEEHLSGFNRVADSDVALGVRLPGEGRNLYLRLRYDF